MRDLNPPAEIRPAVDLAQLAIEARRLRDGIAAAEDTVKRESAKLVQRRKRLGEILVEARAKCFGKRGDGFVEWVEKELELAISTANDYMRAVGYDGGGRGRKPTTDAPDYSETRNNPTQRVETAPAEERPPAEIAPPPNRESADEPGWVCASCSAANVPSATGCAKCGGPRFALVAAAVTTPTPVATGVVVERRAAARDASEALLKVSRLAEDLSRQIKSAFSTAEQLDAIAAQLRDVVDIGVNPAFLTAMSMLAGVKAATEELLNKFSGGKHG